MELLSIFHKHDKQKRKENDIIGYEDIKSFLDEYMAEDIQSSNDMNILLKGGPATSKSSFLKHIERYYADHKRKIFYYDFTNTTGRGFIKELGRYYEENKSRFGSTEIVLLLDEIEKIKPITDLQMLLTLLQDRRIDYITANKKVNIRIRNLNIKIFATCNEVDKLPKPFRSRFLILNLKDYDLEQFVKIAIGIAPRYDIPVAVAEEISRTLFEMEDVDIRQVENVFKIYKVHKGRKSASEIIEFYTQYK